MLPLDPNTVFDRFDEKIVSTIIEKLYTEDDEIYNVSLEEKKSSLAGDVVVTGIQYLLKKCTKDILSKLVIREECSENAEGYKTVNLMMSLAGSGNLKITGKMDCNLKPVIVQRISEKIYENSIAVFLSEQEVETIRKLAEKLNLDGNEKVDLIQKITTEVNFQGLTIFFGSFTSHDLKDWCERCDIDVNSTSKKRLSQALIFGKDVCLSNRPHSVPKNIEKPELLPNINKNEIRDHYTINDLRIFCEDNNLKKGGSKAQLVERVFNFVKSTEEKDIKKRKREDNEGNANKKRRLDDKIDDVPIVDATIVFENQNEPNHTNMLTDNYHSHTNNGVNNNDNIKDQDNDGNIFDDRLNMKNGENDTSEMDRNTIHNNIAY